jgi:hypothetical protein
MCKTRIAAISDVHGNVFALQSVLESIRADGVDVLVNLGDHLSGGVAPAATADLLMKTPSVSIRGKHQRQLLEARGVLTPLAVHGPYGMNAFRPRTRELDGATDNKPVRGVFDVNQRFPAS